MQGLFEDLLVIDCASFIAGPAAATILGDFGARVIKVEPPGTGDGYRMLVNLPGLPRGNSNYPWSLTNRNKESLALDLKDSEGRALLDRLVENADVFITNYPLGVRDRLRLNYEDISAINPRAVYASMTPYGEQGPEAANTGYDATAWWARSGLMDFVRASPDTPPGVSVPGMGDHMAANALYGAIVTALYRRQITGEGAKVGSSLMANGLWSNGVMVQGALDGANTSKTMDSNKLSAFTQIYPCRDGRWFILALLPQVQERLWPQVARCVGCEEWLEDERFATAEARQQHNVELTTLLKEAFEQEDWDEWKRRFDEYGITCGCIAKTADHLSDEQVQANEMLPEWADGSGGRTLDSPLYVDGFRKVPPGPAPAVGEHSEAILTEVGIDASTIEKLKNDGVVGG